MATTWQEIQLTNKQRSLQAILPNGLHVCLIPNLAFSEAHASFTTKYGSIHREFVHPGTNEWFVAPDGVAHFLEHKLFDQPDGSDVFMAFSALGASANAYTSNEQTSYIFSASEHVEAALEVLMDYVQTPYFTPESVAKEQGIIEQEIQMYEDNFNWVAYRIALANAYPIHPVGIDIAGSVASIYQITATDLKQCYETFYHPSNMQLVLSGNFDVATVQAAIVAAQDARAYAPQAPIEVKHYEDIAPPQQRIVKHTIDAQTNYVLALYKDVSRAASPVYEEMLVDILLDMLFSDVSPYYELFVNDQIIDSGMSFYAHYEGDYNFIVTQVKTQQPEAFMALFEKCWKEAEPLTETQFEMVRKMHLGEYIMCQNNLKGLVHEMNRYLPLGITPMEMLDWIKTVTFSEIVAKHESLLAQFDTYMSYAICEKKGRK